MPTYRSVRGAIRSTIKSVVDNVAGIDSVVIGEKVEINYFPFCMIIPGVDIITPDSNQSDMHLIDYWIALVDNNEDLSAGVQSIIDLGADVYDALRADRTLNGVVDDTIFTRFDPRFEIARTYTRHWVLIQMTCKYQMEE